ncbi:hypothetical protein BP422_00265 [Brevibacillus formosus]|uniref:Uncharacterized protein n=1 Tax=Brevibacillus formosus TaxID=54913 RepID=A0A220MBK9_9BACL|nr:hypothetical protein [Brevibacillus formosus]ASJ52120.1 hypothetical protein BP422_00265 [Brevibacillus formosus]
MDSEEKIIPPDTLEAIQVLQRSMDWTFQQLKLDSPDHNADFAHSENIYQALLFTPDAHEALLPHANYVTRHVNDGGISHGLRYIGLTK